MYTISRHAAQRALERFGMGNISKIRWLIEKCANSFWVIDRQLSYDSSTDMARRKIVHSHSPKAYFVVNHMNVVVTVLTQDMAMNNLKTGKWTKL